MVKTQGPTRHKHIPTRTCVACRNSLPKRELVRIVRTPEGQIMIDPTGKKSGRGAYLCRRRNCWEQALKNKNLEYALRTTLNDAERDELIAFAGSLEQEG